MLLNIVPLVSLINVYLAQHTAALPFRSISCPQQQHQLLHNMCESIGFARQGFGGRGAIGVGAVRRCQKLPPCPTEPMPASSKMDPLLGKAKPSSNGGGISVITWLRRKKPLCNSNCSQIEE